MLILQALHPARRSTHWTPASQPHARLALAQTSASVERDVHSSRRQCITAPGSINGTLSPTFSPLWKAARASQPLQQGRVRRWTPWPLLLCRLAIPGSLQLQAGGRGFCHTTKRTTPTTLPRCAYTGPDPPSTPTCTTDLRARVLGSPSHASRIAPGGICAQIESIDIAIRPGLR